VYLGCNCNRGAVAGRASGDGDGGGFGGRGELTDLGGALAAGGAQAAEGLCGARGGHAQQEAAGGLRVGEEEAQRLGHRFREGGDGGGVAEVALGAAGDDALLDEGADAFDESGRRRR
jgi:hypothetical protein